MRFIDVTERTTQGARQGKRKSSKNNSDRKNSSLFSSSSSSSSSSSQSSITKAVVRRRQQQQQHELLPSPTFNFPIPIESVAQVFFFRHYSVAGSIRLYESQRASRMSTLKMMGIVAVGMAGLAISKRDHGVMALARAKYGSTLLSINDAIKVREEVAKESTLAAVTMMARFEVRCWRIAGTFVLSPKLTVLDYCLPGLFYARGLDLSFARCCGHAAALDKGGVGQGDESTNLSSLFLYAGMSSYKASRGVDII